MKHIIECHKIWSVSLQTVQRRSHTVEEITEATAAINLKLLEQAKVEITNEESPARGGF